MIIRSYRWNRTSDEERRRLLARAQLDIGTLLPAVRRIIEAVQTEGDRALRRFTAEFDTVDLGNRPIAVPDSEFDDAEASLSAEIKASLDYAIDNVGRFHETQIEGEAEPVEIRPGILVTERATPIDRVGLYVPSGRGSFPSMMYMLAVPAVLAGVPHLAVCTPPRPDGTVDPAVLYAARRCGVGRVYRVGGAQAIAALAYGTESVEPVHKVVGPGSAYVAAAKRVVAEIVDTGLPAGPSESIVLADATADPHRVTLDLMIEAEHGSDSSALCVTESPDLADTVTKLLQRYIESVPEPRRQFLIDVFSGYGGIIVTDSAEEANEVVNRFAPEHLLIHGSDPRTRAQSIVNAGEILLGPHTAFSLANYAAGANAVLPTGGWARSWNPVSVRDFVKRAAIVEITEAGLPEIRDHVIRLADYEGFYTHAAALRERDRS